MKTTDVQNLWAPWRIAYLVSLDPESNDAERSCFLCSYWNRPDQDADQLVLWRTQRCLVVFNRFPYTGGHLLIAPADHVATLDELAPETMQEMMLLARDAQQVLRRTIKPQGFNVGINIARCAGAGLPDHIHMHVVPRWEGDTNFMSVCGDARVISQGLDDLYRKLLQAARELDLPTVK